MRRKRGANKITAGEERDQAGLHTGTQGPRAPVFLFFQAISHFFFFSPSKLFAYVHFSWIGTTDENRTFSDCVRCTSLGVDCPATSESTTIYYYYFNLFQTYWVTTLLFAILHRHSRVSLSSSSSFRPFEIIAIRTIQGFLRICLKM